MLDYIRHDFKATYLIYLLLFLIPATSLNYYFDFEDSILGAYRDEWYYFFLCYIYYAIPLYYAVGTYVVMYKKKNMLHEKRFVFLLIFLPFILAFDESFNMHKQWVQSIDDEVIRYYLKKTLNHAVRFLTYFIPIVLYYIFIEKENTNFYGLKLKRSDLKPYVFMLFGVMMPLIILVSFTQDFQEAYPVYNMTIYKNELPGEYWQQVLGFESMYLFDFTYIELLFRGIMIHTLYKYMGIECVLAVATVYCTYHYGKPVVETMSSFVGGTILGVLSIRTNSLYGGILIHMGVAFMMEAASFAQQLY
jgi:membrane protease YdiL (CAAX protease family)